MQIPFHGDFIWAVRTADGKIWVSLLRCCDALGIAMTTQLRKLKELHWATIVIMTTVDASGGLRELTMIDLRTFQGWLTTINVNKVRPELRERIEIH